MAAALRARVALLGQAAGFDVPRCGVSAFGRARDAVSIPGLFNVLVFNWLSPKCHTLMQTAVE